LLVEGYDEKYTFILRSKKSKAQVELVIRAQNYDVAILKVENAMADVPGFEDMKGVTIALHRKEIL